MTADEFRTMLKQHDWYYQYSDDRQAHARGRASADAIRAAMAGDPKLQAIYNEFTEARQRR